MCVECGVCAACVRSDALSSPAPDVGDECVAPDVVARQLSLPPELSLHDGLRRDAGVVAGRRPQRRATTHPVPATDHRASSGVQSRIGYSITVTHL